MGGTTLVMDKGELLQMGPTLSVFHHPVRRRVGEVFSDPPMNIIPAVLEGGMALLSAAVRFPLPSHAKGLPGGSYFLGVRPNHVTLGARSGQSVQVPAWIELAEISGSETIVHADHRDGSGQEFHMIAQLTGVHEFSYDEQTVLSLDPQRLFVFDSSGALAASPARENAPRKENG